MTSPKVPAGSELQQWLIKALVSFFMIASTYYLNNINKNMELVRSIQIEQVKDEGRIQELESKVDKLEDFRDKVGESKNKNNSQETSELRNNPNKNIPKVPSSNVFICNTDACLNTKYINTLNNLFKT